ncbi:ATP:cob(I)alamin adenosyltransferase [Gehongia tenuis]|uniref:ATP--cob(I)alamin adenosyltransferase n=1 Tax=Gehongia tenuis TaxID=2763655 RepID=A0A926D327_9FIRM|nr:ATP:cob(I)alamin adenosyltransferase [Gehongia tenuis]MBC8530442.1 ATP--cob(I)alamin adenosyltransferase [Gehongia tenuis]
MYRSPYEAYPFLSEPAEDLRCDFEILTDRIASEAGWLSGMLEGELKEEVLAVAELIYHLNPSLRTFFSVTEAELTSLKDGTARHEAACQDRLKQFVTPQGTPAAGLAHVIRTDCKALVRLLYRYGERHDVDPRVIDMANLLSGYFFALALRLNALAGVSERPFVSRNYKRRD